MQKETQEYIVGLVISQPAETLVISGPQDITEPNQFASNHFRGNLYDFFRQSCQQ